MNNIDWKKKLFNELAYSHDDVYPWTSIIEDFDELNAFVDWPSNEKIFMILIGKINYYTLLKIVAALTIRKFTKK